MSSLTSRSIKVKSELLQPQIPLPPMEIDIDVCLIDLDGKGCNDFSDAE